MEIATVDYDNICIDADGWSLLLCSKTFVL